MTRIEVTLDIKAPIDRTFATITDPKRGPEWNPNIREVVDLSDDPVREGSTWRQVTVMMGRPVTLKCRVVDYEPPLVGTLEIDGSYHGRIRTVCRDLGNAVRVTQVLDFEPPGGALGRMAAGFARPQLQREMTQTLERQRAVLEHQEGELRGPGNP